MNLPPHIDAHVHLVGNGHRGSGCWLRIGATWWQKPLTAYMLSHIGMSGVGLHDPDFDEIYVQHLLRLAQPLPLAVVRGEALREGGLRRRAGLRVRRERAAVPAR